MSEESGGDGSDADEPVDAGHDAVRAASIDPELRHLRSRAIGFRRPDEGDGLVPLVPIGKVRLRALNDDDKPQPGARLRVSVYRDGEAVAERLVRAGPTGYATTEFRVPASEDARIRVEPMIDGEPAEELARTFPAPSGDGGGAEVLRVGAGDGYGLPGTGSLDHGGFLTPPDSLDVELAPELFNPNVIEQNGTCALDFEASVETRQFRFNQLVRRGTPVTTTGARERIEDPVPFDWDGDRPAEDEEERRAVTQASEATLGKLNVFEQSWTRAGHGIGQLLYSLPLAPCEETKIALIEWSREERGRRRERGRVSEQLEHELRRDRMIEESVEGAVEEVQRGHSTTGQVGAGVTGGLASIGKAVAGSVGISLGGSAAHSESYSEGHREVTVQTLHNLEDNVVQRSSSLRSRRSMVVTQSQQAESENIRTRTVRNRNRNHAMTVEYFQVLEHYNVVTELADQIDVLLVPYEVPELLWDEMPEFTRFRPPYARFRAALSRLGSRVASEFDFDQAIDIDLPFVDLQLGTPKLAEKVADSVDEAVEEVFHPNMEESEIDEGEDYVLAETPLEEIPVVAAGNFEAKTPAGVGALSAAVEQRVEELLPEAYFLSSAGRNADLVRWLDRYSDDLEELLPEEHREGFEALYRLVHTPETYENDLPVATVSRWRVQMNEAWQPGVTIVAHTNDGQQVRLEQTSRREATATSTFTSPPIDITAVEEFELAYAAEEAELNAVRKVAEELGISVERVEEVVDEAASGDEGVVGALGFGPMIEELVKEQMGGKAEFDLDRLRITARTDPSEYLSATKSYALLDVSDIGETLDADHTSWSHGTTDTPDIDFDLTETRRYRDYAELEELVAHVKDNRMPYLRALWLREDPDRRALRLENYTHEYYPEDGPGRQVPVLELVENRPVGVMGNSVAFPLQAQGQRLQEGDYDPLVELTLEETRTDKLVSLPTRGVYAETLLSKCNATEVRDVDRMVDARTACDTSAPDITGVSPGSRARDVDLQPSGMPGSVLNIQNPPSAPAPTGTAGALNLLASGDIFRDMSLGTETVSAAQALADRALQESGEAQRSTLEALSTVLGRAQGETDSAEDQQALSAAQERVDVARQRANQQANQAYRNADPVNTRDQQQNLDKALEEGKVTKPDHERGTKRNLRMEERPSPRRDFPRVKPLEVETGKEWVQGRVLLADFAVGSDELRDKHKAFLRDQLMPNLEAGGQGRIPLIEGHASQSGSPDDNQDLSERRAKAVRDFLVEELGLPAHRIREVTGVGQSEPVDAEGPVEDPAERSVVVEYETFRVVPVFQDRETTAEEPGAKQFTKWEIELDFDHETNIPTSREEIRKEVFDQQSVGFELRNREEENPRTLKGTIFYRGKDLGVWLTNPGRSDTIGPIQFETEPITEMGWDGVLGNIALAGVSGFGSGVRAAVLKLWPMKDITDVSFDVQITEDDEMIGAEIEYSSLPAQLWLSDPNPERRRRRTE